VWPSNTPATEPVQLCLTGDLGGLRHAGVIAGSVAAPEVIMAFVHLPDHFGPESTSRAAQHVARRPVDGLGVAQAVV